MHAIAPVSQRFALAHAEPVEHATQRPMPSHTPPGHAAPAGASPLLTHTAAPDMHAIAPVLHGLLGVHAMPAVHALQRPMPSHTPPGHASPAGRLALVAHTGAPDAHEIIPVVHALPVLQLIPVAHATQVPVPSHTPPAHGAPALRGAVTSQTGAPDAHEIIPD